MAKRLYVQEGKSCTSNKGILEAGTEVKAVYFETPKSEKDHGEKMLERLEKKGVIGSKVPQTEKKEDSKPVETKAEEK